ncbi:MAG: metallophosphoesterase [Mangrovibacterium sp.]
MRGLSASGIIIFFIVILFIELIAYLGIIQLASGRRARRFVTIIYWAISVSVISIWLSAFLNPAKIRETADYDYFYFVISISVLNLFPKALMAIFSLAGLLLRLFHDKYYAKLVSLAGVIISFGMLLSIGYGLLFGKNQLQVNHIELVTDGLPAQLDKLTVVQISDLHLGSFNNDSFVRKIAEKINELNPDLLLFTGDIVNNYYQEMIGFEDALALMKARYGKFAIFGNHDYGDYSNWKNEESKRENHRIIGQQLSNAGFILLQNESYKVSLNDTCLYLVGVENWGHKPFPQYAQLDKAMANIPEPAFTILLSHDPAHWEDEVVPKTSIPLTLSGHTHGGQFGLKIGGISFSPMYLIQPLWAGLYKQDGQFLYVNQGTGSVGFPGRIDMNPELTVLTLRSNSPKIN